MLLTVRKNSWIGMLNKHVFPKPKLRVPRNVKMLVAKPDSLKLNPRIHRVEGEI